MSDLIRREDVLKIALEYTWGGAEVLRKRLRALPAVQPDAELAMRIAVKMEAHAALGTNTKAKADAILALIDKPGKEVMPDVPDANSTHQSDAAPAGNMTAGGGAEKRAGYSSGSASTGHIDARIGPVGGGAGQRAVQPDAAALIRWHDMLLRDFGDDLSSIVRAEMLAMLDKPAVQPHVTETPKSEHDAANMLTPATKGGDA